jgi:hypothetical protein
MDSKKRNAAIAVAAAAVLAVGAAAFFAARSKTPAEKAVSADADLKSADDSSFAESAAELQETNTAASNYDRFSYKVSAKAYEEAVKDMNALDIMLYDRFTVYEGTGCSYLYFKATLLELLYNQVYKVFGSLIIIFILNNIKNTFQHFALFNSQF